MSPTCGLLPRWGLSIAPVPRCHLPSSPVFKVSATKRLPAALLRSIAPGTPGAELEREDHAEVGGAGHLVGVGLGEVLKAQAAVQPDGALVLRVDVQAEERLPLGQFQPSLEDQVADDL